MICHTNAISLLSSSWWCKKEFFCLMLSRDYHIGIYEYSTQHILADICQKVITLSEWWLSKNLTVKWRDGQWKFWGNLSTKILRNSFWDSFFKLISLLWLFFNVRSYLVVWVKKQVKTLRQRQNARFLADDTFKCSFLNQNVWIEIWLKYVPLGGIDNNP